MAKSEVFHTVDEMSLALQNARKIPFSDAVMVNQDVMLDLLKKIHASFDPSLERADKIIANEESILNDASVKAQKTMASAQEQAQGMVNEANNYAQHTKAGADIYATDVRNKADEQARAVMADAHARAQHMIEDANAQADELVSQTSVLARAEAEAHEILENANQHAFALRKQTNTDLMNMLDHVHASVSAQLNEIRLIRDNIESVQTYPEETEG